MRLPIPPREHICSYRRDSNSWPLPYQGSALPAELLQLMYWLSSVITTIPVRIWRLAPNQLVRPFGRIYRWDFRLYFSSHCHVPIPYCHHSWSGLYILVMYARLKVPSYRTSWFVNTLWCASSRCHLFATLQRLGADGEARTLDSLIKSQVLYHWATSAYLIIILVFRIRATYFLYLS